MHRKKPFSAKQKKKQLQDKRRRKQGEGASYDVTADVGFESGEDLDQQSKTAGGTDDVLKSVHKLNQQPADRATGSINPNRYRLHFFQEKKEDLANRKELASQPYTILPEEQLEMRVDISLESAIDIPKRPPWDYTLSKARLQSNEETYFRGYLENLFKEHKEEELSYFEVNLETWRQLWRVLEMSDIFLIIVDIRHPLMHFPPALYKHITHDLKKSAIVVLNKIDLAPPSLVVAWQHYFKERFPLVEVVCFTSYPKTQRELEAMSGALGKVVFKRRKRGTFRAMGPEELYNTCTALVPAEVDLTSWKRKIAADQKEGACFHGDKDSEDGDGDVDTGEVTKTVRRLDLSYEHRDMYRDGVLTIGCVGYPNVGKSSVINGLMGKKVVSVSKSPGHTKHFQTIYLTPSVCLCDCPGLVFPSRVEKNLQILGGLYPIAQVREPFSVVGYLAERMNLPWVLGLMPVEKEADARTHRWSAMDVCEAWALKRGFVTAKAARLDAYRAANNLLRLALEGRLCLCLYPSGYTKHKEYWGNHDEAKTFIEMQSSYTTANQASSDQEFAESSSEGEMKSGQGRQLHDESSESDDDSPNLKPVISNRFALLEDD